MKKKKRIDITESGSLAHQPFAQGLAGLGTLREQTPPVEKTVSSETVSKNSLLVQEEKRAKGKWVTCIYHLEEDPKVHLKKLKQLLGTGGRISENGILEIQGRKRDATCTYLLQCGFQVR